jgi:hypothetical protein
VQLPIGTWPLPEGGPRGIEPWRGGLNSVLPSFDTHRVFGVCRELRGEIRTHLLSSLRDLRRDVEGPTQAGAHSSEVLLAAEASRYGAIYWLTSRDARTACASRELDSTLIDEYGAWFEAGGTLHRLWSKAIAAFLYDRERRHLITDRFVPKGGFQPLGAGTVCIGEADLAKLTGAGSSSLAMLDLHDLAHQAAASLCPELYGNRLHSRAFHQLPAQLRDLVAGFDSTRTPQHADGTVFGGFLSHLFNESVDVDAPEAEIVEHLAKAIMPYMLGEGALFLPASGAWTQASRSVDVYEAAVLAQNKAYELPASELEQLMFTRGGLDGRDQLANMSTSERVRAIGRLQGRTYHEARNTLKHRAQALAYQRTVEELWRRHDLSDAQRDLAARTFRHLRFQDHRSGMRRDLFRDVATVLSNTEVDLGGYPDLQVTRSGDEAPRA